MLKKTVKIMSLLLILAMLMSLAACGQGGTTGAAAGGETTAKADSGAAATGAKVKLTHWSGFTGSDRPVLEKVIQSFNATSTTSEIELSVMTWDVLDQKLTAGFASNSGPDFFAYGPEILGKYYNMGALLDIEEMYSSGVVDKAIFPESVIGVPVFEGKTIAAPMCVFNVMVYYNKDMFAEAGISDIPKTQDEMLEMAKKLTKLDANGNVEQYGLAIGYSDVFTNFMWGYGLEPVDTATNKCLILEPDQKALVQKLSEFVLNDKISPEIASTGMDTLFNTKKLAMYINGPWATTASTEAGVNYDVFDFPAGPKASKVSGHPLFYIPTKFIGEKLKNFYEWESYWSSKEQQGVWAAGTGYPTIRVDMKGDPALKDSWAAKFSQAADKFTVRNYATYQNSGKINDEEFKNAWESICLGEATVDEALSSATAKVDKYLEAK